MKIVSMTDKEHLLLKATRPVGIVGYGAYVPRCRLHTRQITIATGAEGEMVDVVAGQMVAEGVVRIDRAEEILKSL
jgi:hypothetical protein